MSKPSPDPLFTLKGDMGAIHSLLFQLSPTSEHIYASTQDGLVYKWNLQSCREEFQMKVSEETCLTLKSFKNCLVSQIKGGEIKLWEETEGSWKLKAAMKTDYWGFCKVDIFNEFLLCPDSGSKIWVVDQGGKKVSILQPSSEKCGEIMSIKCFTKSETDFVFLLFENGVLMLLTCEGNKMSELKITSDCPMALDFDGDCKGVVGSSGDAIEGFKLSSDLTLVKWRTAKLTNAGVSSVAIRPDRQICAVGCWDARLRLFSWRSLKLLAVLFAHTETLQDVCFSPARVAAWDAEWLLAAAGKDGRITLWNLY